MVEGFEDRLFLNGGNPAETTLWSSSATPQNPAEADSSAVEVGVKFTADVTGSITGIRFYKDGTNTGTHVGNLWTAGGTLLASATFGDETASGWQQVTFSSPVAITANTTYVASYHAPNGHYAEDDNSFASSGVDNAPLHALAAGVDGPDGVYTYSASSAFPTSTYLSANYWVDVVFSQNVLLQTSAADFSATGTQLAGTVVTNNSGGEVQLAPSFSDDFNGSSLSSSWTSTPWPGVTPNVAVSGGALSVAGAGPVDPGRTLPHPRRGAGHDRRGRQPAVRPGHRPLRDRRELLGGLHDQDHDRHTLRAGQLGRDGHEREPRRAADRLPPVSGAADGHRLPVLRRRRAEDDDQQDHHHPDREGAGDRPGLRE